MNRPDLPADTLQKNNLFFRQLLFLGILITIGLVILKQLGFFVGAFLGASTLYVVLRSLLFRLTERHSWRSWLAAALLVLCTTVLLLGLGFLIYEVIAAEIPNVDTSKIVGFFEKQVIRLNELIGFEAIPKDLLENSGTFLTKMVSSLINTTYSFAANVFMMLVILYFMLLKGRKMERHINSYVPFKGKSLCLLKQEVKTIIFSNALGIPIVMLSQALAACLIYWLLGMNNIVFWAFVTAVCGLIPMVGTVIVSVPLGAYMIYSGELWQGILMIALGVLVIANVDNLCRMILMNKVADTHPLIVIFGVILGIPLFGFWGIIFGPLLISGFLLLMKIYYKEYDLLPQEAQARENAAETRCGRE
ncbi:AI-2E family transporter [Alistipes ihumii]|uniref:AI-2E family transporter n=1 Tax=Alistipes ihumii TaxID=1470347 RepID=UPI00266633FA|nr:AI-2E family transporter [Alistipes ihumii]